MARTRYRIVAERTHSLRRTLRVNVAAGRCSAAASPAVLGCADQAGRPGPRERRQERRDRRVRSGGVSGGAVGGEVPQGGVDRADYTTARYPDAANGVPYEVYDLVTAEAKVRAAEEAVAWIRRLMNG